MKTTYAMPHEMMDVEFALPDAATTAGAVLSGALEYCAARMRLPDPGAALEQLRSGDRSVWSYFDYGVAGHLAEHLGALDEEVKAVYLYEDEATPDDAAFGEVAPSMIHLLIWAQRKTGALTSLLSALDLALGQTYAGMMGATEARYLVDLQVIDDSEVAAGTGYGAMLRWLHHRPLLVWKR
jgi:hypothetical protein